MHTHTHICTCRYGSQVVLRLKTSNIHICTKTLLHNCSEIEDGQDKFSIYTCALALWIVLRLKTPNIHKYIHTYYTCELADIDCAEVEDTNHAYIHTHTLALADMDCAEVEDTKCIEWTCAYCQAGSA
jgi:hypothetical protein